MFVAAPSGPQREPTFDELAVVLPTSGTTGPTKGVRCGHSHALHYAECANAMRRLTADDVVYATTPLFHSDGLFASALGALVAGAQLVLAPGFSPRRFWRDVVGHGATTFAYAGGMISLLWHQAPPPPGVQHRLRVGYGAPSPPHLVPDFERVFGCRLIEGYGSTELGLPPVCPWDDARVDQGSAGVASTGYDVVVADAADRPLPPGAVGEILVRPRHPGMMFLGYQGRPDLLGMRVRNLWFDTGDLGRFRDGHLHFLGRAADTVRRRGERLGRGGRGRLPCARRRGRSRRVRRPRRDRRGGGDGPS